MALIGIFSKIPARFGRTLREATQVNDTESRPLRAELFNLEQLKRHARMLAERHPIASPGRSDKLLDRLAQNERVLLHAYRLTSDAFTTGAHISPAAEWLLDNFYLIEEQIRLARRHMPRTYNRELPHLLDGPLAGSPRVYDIALELISHVDGRLDAETLTSFVASYQTTTPLKLGELWAVPIMLRLALIENIRRVAGTIARRREQRNLAATWANRLLKAAENDPHRLPQVLADVARSNPPLASSPFMQELFGKLQGQSPALTFVLTWFEHQLGEQGLTMERLLSADSQILAADQVSIGNSINSLRFLSATDWREFVETMSVVEAVLRQDPSNVHAQMDFATRDRYRHCVEEIAKRSQLSEDQVARTAVKLAADAGEHQGSNARAAHVGYYLIDTGRSLLEGAVSYRKSLVLRIARMGRRHSLLCYVASIAALTAMASGMVLSQVGANALAPWQLGLIGLLLIISASQMAVGIVMLLTIHLIRPRLLPRLDYSDGIPPLQRTMVVVPAMLTSPKSVTELLENLEIRYLGNRDPNLSFALLTDFRDADEATQPDDEQLLQQARDGVSELNEKYSADRQTGFYLFHRARVWNPHEQIWMGYERKRGKMEQFNALIRDGKRESFVTIVGDESVLAGIKYVITLDADTQLPRDAARRLVGNMAHPLNRPYFDPATGRVVDGYSILQPRVSVSLQAAARSHFARLFAGEAGLDPYTREVSDFYQDLFSAGSYVGKGIYDVETFHQAVGGRFPDNLILSHDLIEGCYARSGLVTDVELIEDHPSSYFVEASRRHRWIRGDWQIAAWLLPRVPGSDGKRHRNLLPALARWKIFDNLRRNIVAPATLLLLITGWMLAPVPAGLWPGAVVTFGILPSLVAAVFECLRKPSERSWRIHLDATAKTIISQLAQVCLTLAFIPYRAWLNLDAIANSGVRMLFTRRGLLLWYTPSYTSRNARRTFLECYLEMWFAPVVAIAAFVYLANHDLQETMASGPLLVLWLMAPAIAWWISQPLKGPKKELAANDRMFLRILARRTWRYFEEFVAPQDNWLPPDNFQEVPESVITSRTSPTNIGMTLLANLAALDFGYISPGRLLQRTESTLSTLEKLERYRGHFYNWYDTRTLKILPPLYVSSVDSGNLLGALWTLRAGLLELKTQPIFPSNTLAGLADTLRIGSQLFPLPEVHELQEKLKVAPASSGALVSLLKELSHDAATLVGKLKDNTDEQLRWWVLAFERQCNDFREDLTSLIEDGQSFDEIPSLRQLAKLPTGGQHATDRIKSIDNLAQRCSELAQMDFTFLQDPVRDLLSIGYNVADRRRDPSCYDLLASEARLTSFLLIAQNQLAQEHWFALGRQVTGTDGAMALISWSGSMFEYLMPALFLPSYENTLLDQTNKAVVARQIEYGKQRGVPWGISESCYAATDAHRIYQYRAFGVPGLGFKRGLADDLVIAPYASALALMVAPKEACRNLQSMATSDGYLGNYGFHEAIDFTPLRLPRGKTEVLVRSFMAHHQGMSLLAIGDALLGQPTQRRFMADPACKAAELLLQERIPKAATPLQPHSADVSEVRRAISDSEAIMRVFKDPNTPVPEVHLLSNGRYHVMVTNSGGGNSRWNDLAVTRWREDATRDCWGTFCYLRDVKSGTLWSTTYQPTLHPPKTYEAIFLQARAEYRRRDEEIDVHTEICVSPEDDVEVRRIKVTNLSHRTRMIELTSYAEVVLAPQNADLAHPVFSNLFIQTEIVRGDRQAILCTRRPKSEGEKPPWMLHLMTVQGVSATETSYETDREKFIGRGRTTVNPIAFTTTGRLSDSEGPVLDPIVSVRRVVTLKPDESATVHIISGVGESREVALALVDKYRDPGFVDRAFEMSWSHSQILLRHLNAKESDAQVFGRLASSILYANSRHRAKASILVRNRRGQSSLWPYAVSGDLPIVFVRIGNTNRAELVHQALRAHAYWRMKGLLTDLVILNEDFSGYRETLQDRIMGLVATGVEAHLLDKPGGVFVRRADQMSEEDRILFQTAARVVLDADRAETMDDQVDRRLPAEPKIPRFEPTRSATSRSAVESPMLSELILFNGLGGFTPDGREYVMMLKHGMTTPAPWSNVLANARIGSVVSESGSAYTWVDNAHEFRLTNWHNDPLCDTSGEALYIRDEETGRFWSPTPLPARGSGTYKCRHGFGYSVFEYAEDGIASELCTYVAADAPVKFFVVTLRNHSGQSRRLSVTGYWEWVLGQWRHANLMHVVTEIDPNTGAVFASNPYNREFADKVAFAHVNSPTRTVTANRTEFLGPNGTLAKPSAMGRARLSGKVGAGLDPCAAVQARINLADGQEGRLVFVVGAGRNREDAQYLVRQHGDTGGAQQSLEAQWEYWKRTLGQIHVDTPDQSVNVLANGWLLYQTLACRYWARSGYYQSGGAYGFRDQLQDVMALVHAAPGLTREHLLRCAGRQFREGDVQHWWHPPAGRGVRTHFSDDYLWLPYATCCYVSATADMGVLDQPVPLLEGRAVNADEEAYYDLPSTSEESVTLYEHCVRAIRHALRFGEHGLPLMGCGDWNDSMNLVGHQGKGESVWLAFFLYDVLRQFSELARRKADISLAEECKVRAERLGHDIEQHAWDGQWYRRAYFDDGTPLGSSTNDECQIDSIAQSWAVLSRAADSERARMAMSSLDTRLVNRNSRLIQLLDPPFDKTALQPGYIRGYPPGVRENGGQYTHAAIWAVMAFAQLGESERAWELFKLLNPITHATDVETSNVYKVEPYVVAADIYSRSPHTGRGGWTWYTGSAGWMYRLIVQTLLGVNLEGNKLRLRPCLPDAWDSCKIQYRYRDTVYHITFHRTPDAEHVTIDGVDQPGAVISLVDDRKEHQVKVYWGARRKHSKNG